MTAPLPNPDHRPPTRVPNRAAGRIAGPRPVRGLPRIAEATDVRGPATFPGPPAPLPAPPPDAAPEDRLRMVAPAEVVPVQQALPWAEAAAAPPADPTAAFRPGRTPLGQLTVRPVPRSDPPYDDELPRPPLRLVGVPARPRPGVSSSLAAAPLAMPRPAAALPPIRAWLEHMLVVVLECLEGWRPYTQLRAHATPLVVGTLMARHRPVCRNETPRVRSVHTSEPTPGVIEACAVIQRAQAVQAVAIRVEEFAGRWRCTTLHVLE